MEAGHRERHEKRTFDGDTASIGSTRRFVLDCVDGIVDSARSGDLELAISELVTNAVEHAGGEPVTVAVTTTRERAVIEVVSALSASVVDDPATWAGPTGGSQTGRGLMIVRAVSDHVTVSFGERAMTIRCEFVLG